MSDEIVIIGDDQYYRVTKGIPEGLLATIEAIDKVNSKGLSLKGLSESIAQLNDFKTQLSSVYSTISTEQQKASMAVARLAKANKDNAAAELSRAKAAVLNNKEEEKAVKKVTDALKAKNAELAKRKISDIPLEITNETKAINENTAATIGNTAITKEDAEAHAIANAATANQTPKIEANTNATLNNNAALRQRLSYFQPLSPMLKETAKEQDNFNKKVEESGKSSTKSIAGIRGLWSSIRQLAYILPGVGIAGIFAAIFAGINEIYTAAVSANKGAKESQEGYNKSVEEGTKALGDEVGELQRVQGLLTDTSKTRGEITSIVSALSEKYPEYISFLVAERGSMEDINAAINQQINLLRERALETAARKEAKDAEANYEEAIQKVTEALTQNAKWYQKVIGFVTGNSGANVAYIQSMANAQTAIDRLNASRQRESDVIQSNIDMLTRASLDRRIEIDEIINQTTGSDKLNSSQLTAIEVRKQQIKSINELIGYYKELREAAENARFAEDSQVNNDVKYWQARVNMARKGSKELVAATTELASASREKELADLKNKYIVEKKIREADLADNKTYQAEVFLINSKAIKAQNDAKDLYERKNRPKRVQDPVNEIIAAQKRLTDAERDAEVERLNRTISINDQIYQYEKTSSDDRIAAFAEMQDARLQIAKLNRDKEIQDINDWLEQRQGEIDKANATEKSKQTEHQKALLIDEEAMFTKRRAAELKYRADVADIISTNTIAAQNLIKGLDAETLKQGQDSAKKDLEITENYFKRKNALRKSDAKEEKLYWETVSKDINYASQGLNEVGQLLDTLSKKKIEQIESQKDALDEQLQTEIDAINASTDSEETKQTKIKEAQNKTATAKKALDEQEKQRKISAAKTDKAIAIMQIILNTAQAVTKNLAAGPAGIPLAIAAGIAGAAQLAIAVATPIPQYMHGTDYHKGGDMIVGDGGERELIISGNKMEWSPDTATLMTKPKGTKVIPEHVLMDSILSGQSSLNGGSIFGMNDAMMREMINSNSRIEKAIKKMPSTKVNIDRHGFNMSHQKGNAYTQYVNSKINL